MTALIPEQRCTKRPTTTWPNCRCPKCLNIRRRLDKHRRAGILPARVPARVAWASMDRMLGLGWSATAIASATGLPANSVKNLVIQVRNGQRRKLGRGVAARLANPGQPTDGLLGATGTVRRVHALAAGGWPVAAIATAAGLPLSVITVLRAGNRPHVTAQTAAAIARAYTALSSTPGPSDTARKTAADLGWAPPLAWDDDTIDDPAAEPVGVRRDLSRRPADELVDETEDLVSQGESLATAARRLGMAAESLERALYRAERADLVRRLKGTDEAAMPA